MKEEKATGFYCILTRFVSVLPPTKAFALALQHLQKDNLSLTTPPTLAQAGTFGARK